MCSVAVATRVICAAVGDGLQDELAVEIASLRAQLHTAVQAGLNDEARFHLQRQAVIDDLHAFNVGVASCPPFPRVEAR